MKKILNVLIVTILLVSTSCNSKKQLAKENKLTEIELPFSESKYKTDKNYFRAVEVGKSPDLTTAKKMALVNAKASIAGSIDNVVKSVTEQYTNQRGLSEGKEWEQKFEENIRISVKQRLSDVVIKDTKYFTDKDGNYECWLVAEVSKDNIFNGMNSDLSKNAKMQIDYDQQKFREIFDQEMNKLIEDNF